MTVGVYDNACPRCGAEPREPCWNIRTRDANAWPHRERHVATKDGTDVILRRGDGGVTDG